MIFWLRHTNSNPLGLPPHVRSIAGKRRDGGGEQGPVTDAGSPPPAGIARQGAVRAEGGKGEYGGKREHTKTVTCRSSRSQVIRKSFQKDVVGERGGAQNSYRV